MKNAKMSTILVLALGLMVWLSGVSEAAPMGTAFTYQGRLIDANDAADGLYDLQFKLYDSPADGNQFGSTIDINDLDVIDGQFALELDFGSDPNIFNGDVRWLETTVSHADGSDPCTLSPRQEVTPTPYALYSKTAGSVKDGVSWSEVSDRPAGLDDGDDVGITSETDPTVLTSVKDGISWSEVSSRPAGLDDGDDDTQLTEAQVDTFVANNGYLDGSSALDWDNITIDMPAGFADGVDNVGGDSDWTISVSGSDMYSAVSGNVGIGTTNPGYKLTVSTSEPTGRAVFGEATSVLETNYGSYFTAAGKFGRGVYGVATNSGGYVNYGGFFQANGAGGRGVYGLAFASSGTNYGVYGKTNSSNGFAGWFSGKVHITGNLSKSSGSFKIDHPLDPENKYLQHSFVESPDMMNVYNGNAALDENGEACVQLPEYFEALNRQFRYQLTCIGGFAPVYIAEEISNNRFKIAGGKKGMKVSWQVTGIRQDAYAEANRIVVEENKSAEERGYYLNPMAYGLPEEKGIESVHNPRVSETRQVAKKVD